MPPSYASNFCGSAHCEEHVSVLQVAFALGDFMCICCMLFLDESKLGICAIFRLNICCCAFPDEHFALPLFSCIDT